MGLTRVRLGDVISPIDERNANLIKRVCGIDKTKTFVPTKANTSNVDLTKYKVVRLGRFGFSGMQTGRDKCIRVAMSRERAPFVISPAYTTFGVTDDSIDLTYLFMHFLSPEMDRKGWFYSDGSIRANLDWSVFCDIEIELPPINLQRKYVAIYESMLANQRAYESGLDDLKLACDVTIDKLVHNQPLQSIEPYVERHDIRNEDNSNKNVMGVSVTKTFRNPTAKVDVDNLANYKIVKPSWFSFVQTTKNEKCFAFAFNDTGKNVVVTSVNEVFSVDEYQLCPEYLALLLNRSEFDRYAIFHSWGSARETFTWNDFLDVRIPLPDLEVQQSLGQLYKCWMKRRAINEHLKAQLKDICPVLIRGSIEESEG
ncbi:MAG: restriction endonuclease subunit S [Eggerthellaceae bacterium]|jgi:type I restriction enzyme S subunit